MAQNRKMVSEAAVAAYETRVDANGRIVLPAAVRRRLGLGPGDGVIIRTDADGVRVLAAAEAVREAQALVRSHVRGKGSLVEELLAWRRSEAERD
jgi:AbrB family looped-hinge helix DNA binding protein